MPESGFVSRPDYRVDVHRVRNRIEVVYAGQTLADSTAALLVNEQDHGIVFYIPANDVRFDLLTSDVTTSRCPYKGEAKYWRSTSEPGPLAWEYHDPYPEVAILRDHIAFYQDRVRLTVGVADPAVSGR